ncbi:hypothetical protein PIB30_033392 [Stylosanthes scabra]|uniref:Uncharacterized protein n=1 Tax=Stylosanthes scabra TaxID=79078 RepID=A0ABU6QCF0_9FABA|nr:hypothetical protein [Stylosanthes scabra]
MWEAMVGIRVHVLAWSGVGEFKCPFYKKNTGPPTARYKVEVMSRDSTGCINLVLWEREVKRLCRKTTYKIKEELVQGDDDYPDYP